MKVVLGGDAMAAQILKDHEGQIARAFRESRGVIADIASYHRESWKAELRRAVLPLVPLEPAAQEEGGDPAPKRKIYGKERQGLPWYPALAQELVAEEVESDAAARKERLLASLVIPEPAPVKRPSSSGKASPS